LAIECTRAERTAKQKTGINRDIILYLARHFLESNEYFLENFSRRKSALARKDWNSIKGAQTLSGDCFVFLDRERPAVPEPCQGAFKFSQPY
jgi:hypothetical protein